MKNLDSNESGDFLLSLTFSIKSVNEGKLGYVCNERKVIKKIQYGGLRE